MAKVLLINPSLNEIYRKAKLKESVPHYFPVSLLTIATPLIEAGHVVKLLDLNLYNDFKEPLIRCLDEFSPHYTAITFATPLYSHSLEIVSIIKNHKEDITVVAGGTHITSDFLNTMKNSKIDIGVIGEADFKLKEIMGKKDLRSIKSIVYKEGGQIIENERGSFLQNLDDVPFPATELIDINSYNVPHTYCKQNPVFPLETSRGCIFGCVYCNKSIFGNKFRAKSPERVIDDLKKIRGLGYKEVQIIDDGFTTDIERAKEICRRIIKEKINLFMNCPNGIRADKVDLELLQLMKKAGFYRVSFGVESGSQEILDKIGKNLKLEDVTRAFKLCKKVGIETVGFFMFGLPGETEEDLKRTIKFAKQLKPDIAKFGIMIPFPSTPIYKVWQKKGCIISTNWDDYGFYKEEKVYKHPNLEWETIARYLNKAYRSFYLSPGFIIRRFFKSLKEGNLLKDIKIFFKVNWFE